MNSQYVVYNKDSRYLEEVLDGTVDFVVTSPPFNICHKYKSYHDSLDFKDFNDLYDAEIQSISRVLKDDGYFVVDIADMIVMENKIIYGAEFVKEKACSSGLEFLGAFPYIAIEGSDKKMKSCISRINRKILFHSTCEQVLVFGKSFSSHEVVKSFCLKSSYRYSLLKDSAFWPDDLVSDILSPFSMEGKVLLDPFMGSGTIGRMVMVQGGYFIGYDVDGGTLRAYKWI